MNSENQIENLKVSVFKIEKYRLYKVIRIKLYGK